jgi:hypothetical protein
MCYQWPTTRHGTVPACLRHEVDNQSSTTTLFSRYKIQDTRYPNNRHHCPLMPNCRYHLCACLRLCPLSIAQLCRAWGVGCGVECLLACLLAACFLLRCCVSTNFPRAPHIRLPSPAAIYRSVPFPNSDRMMLFVTYGRPTCRALLVTNGRLHDCTTNQEPVLRRCSNT